MEQYIIVYSRYVITFFMILYTFFALFRTFTPTEKWRGCDNFCSVLIFLMQFAAHLTICVEKGSVDYLFFYALSQLVLFASMTLFLMLYPDISRLLLNNMCILLGTGLIMLVRLDMEKAVRQLLIAAFSMAAAMVLIQLIRKTEKLTKMLTWLYAILGLAALGAVLILGQATNGSQLSYNIAGVTFQPSEFVKLLFVFFTAAMLWQDRSFRNVVLCSVFAAAHVLILVLSRDLGSALIFFVTYVFLVFLATGNYIYLLLGAAGGSAAAAAAFRLFVHVQVRVQAWKDPWTVIDSQGYQITQSLFAMSRGGWFGLGIGQGTPKDIPFVETDFIFAAITEELGILYAVCLILICLSCFIFFVRIALKTGDRFYRLIAAGLAIVYLFQIFLTVGGEVKFIPLTGVTLPLVSYGGSSVMTTLFLLAVIQGIFLRQTDPEKGRERKNGRNFIEADEDGEEEYEEYEEEREEDYRNSPEREIIWEEEDY